MVSKDFLVQLEGYGLTTAEIHYHMPDHPRLLQQFIWQDYDLAPLFPGLEADANKAALWCFSNFGNMVHCATPDKLMPKTPDEPLQTR